MNALRGCAIDNTMTAAQKERREELRRMGKKSVKANPDLQREKDALDQLWRESPIVFGGPFGMRIVWFLDERSWR